MEKDTLALTGKTSKLPAGQFYKKRIKPNLILYIFLIPAVAYALVFCYAPMYGIVISFKRFNPGLGIMGSPWMGLQNFQRFFDSAIFWTLLGNTLKISIYSFLAGMPVPIILALAFKYCYHERFKKVVQTTTYAPYFISTVVLVGMLYVFLSPRNGLVNMLIVQMGGETVNFLMDERWFLHLYVWSGVWQGSGFDAVIYIAALAGVSPKLHEASIMDGATKIRRMWHIDLPVLMPTFIILQILALGGIMSVSFEKAYLMQNPANSMVSEIIATYTYRLGILGGEYSYTTAFGLFNNVINMIPLIGTNTISRKFTKLGVI